MHRLLTKNAVNKPEERVYGSGFPCGDSLSVKPTMSIFGHADTGF